MSSQERRRLVSRLKEMGAIRVEVRLGEQGRTYSVVHVRREHPLVRKVLETE